MHYDAISIRPPNSLMSVNNNIQTLQIMKDLTVNVSSFPLLNST